MATLQIDKDMVQALYKKADKKTAKLLEEMFGLENLKGNVMDRVKTLEDACRECGKDYAVEFAADRVKWLTPDELAYKQWGIIAEALNEGWVPDYSNNSEYKYYPWYKWVSGRGLSLGVVYCDDSFTLVGPRLVMKSEALVQYAIKQFPETFNNFFNPNK